MARQKQRRVRVRTRWLVVLGVFAAVLLVAGVLWAMNFQQERLNDPPVVSVNGEPIYTSEVWAWSDRVPPEDRDRYSPEVIVDQLIDQRLILQHAAEQGVVISDEQLQAAVDEQLSFYGTSREELTQALEAQGESFEEFEQGVHDELVFRVFVNEVLIPSIRISDSQVQGYYQDNIEEFSADPGEVRVRHLLVETEEEAAALREEVLSGAEFSTLATAYSLDSAPRGGDLGFISEESSLVEPFKQAALVLSVGEVSEPVQTEFGWHLIKREEDVIPLREARQIIADRLREQRAQQEFGVLLSELRENATIRYHRGFDALG